jgi:hypothetical protein
MIVNLESKTLFNVFNILPLQVYINDTKDINQILPLVKSKINSQYPDKKELFLTLFSGNFNITNINTDFRTKNILGCSIYFEE